MQSISDFISDSNSGKANIKVDTSIYNIEAIHATAYQFTGNYHVLITPDVDGLVTIIFEAKDNNIVLIDELKEFATSLIDYQVRYNLDKTNGKIREIIVKHAFSPLDLHKVITSL